MEERIKSINPLAETINFKEFIDLENMETLIKKNDSDKIDFCIEAIDSPRSKSKTYKKSYGKETALCVQYGSRRKA